MIKRSRDQKIKRAIEQKMQTDKNKFRAKLREKMDQYVHFVYRVTKKFPKDEVFGVTSQLRRSALSVILNHIEGFARIRPAVQLNFLEISYGSLQESKYLLEFSYVEEFLAQENHEYGINLAEEIGAMLWTEMTNLNKKTSIS